MKRKLLFLFYVAVEFTSSWVQNNFYFPLYFPDSFRRKQNYMFQFDFAQDSFPLIEKGDFSWSQKYLFSYTHRFDVRNIKYGWIASGAHNIFPLTLSRTTSNEFPMPFISSAATKWRKLCHLEHWKLILNPVIKINWHFSNLLLVCIFALVILFLSACGKDQYRYLSPATGNCSFYFSFTKSFVNLFPLHSLITTATL